MAVAVPAVTQAFLGGFSWVLVSVAEATVTMMTITGVALAPVVEDSAEAADSLVAEEVPAVAELLSKL